MVKGDMTEKKEKKLSSYQKLKLEYEKAKKKIKELEIQNDENYKKLQRAVSDMENLRRITEKEKKDYVRYANMELIKKILPTIDEFEKSIVAIEKLELDDNKKNIVDGIKMIYTNLLTVLKNEGLLEIKCKGEKFNPYFHEALTTEVDESLDENTIIEELQKGYMFNDMVIRPAMVKVSRKV